MRRWASRTPTRLEEGESFTTLELKANYLRAVTEGRLAATGRVVHAGRTIGLTTCDVVDGEGRKVAHATSTCMTLRNPLGSPRRKRR